MINNIRDIYTCRQEYSCTIHDKFDRFRYYMSNYNALDPIISSYLHNNLHFKPIYPNDKKFAVCISHDVDYLFDYKSKISFLKSAIAQFKNNNPKASAYNFKRIFRKIQNPNWSLEHFIKFEKENKIQASYYFLALDNHEEDFNYNIKSQLNVFEKLEGIGAEIGLHGGHQAFDNLSKLKQEKDNLEAAYGKTVKGYRNHYLRFKTPNTWNNLNTLNFNYDTTFGFADMPGYRNGLCYPFRPFDLKTNSYINILEIPLLVMDVTFFKYLGLSVSNAYLLFQKIYSEVKKLNGVLTVLWHNNCLEDDYLKLYDKIMGALIADDESWITTNNELANWWKANNLSKMETLLNKHLFL